MSDCDTSYVILETGLAAVDGMRHLCTPVRQKLLKHRQLSSMRQMMWLLCWGTVLLR